ncbi:MAG TPA: uroporphyrinogen decarboxylase family protein [Candidatus Hydrogenedentes bacterium]|nr:uroporphyrinogen decarboxylase family protein [Candidatus Hydrogenedentota bacterium]HPG66254.1 uroporphyrinogen decarboxylase family protein [Candidatus Hydrogenedentota bacterium]
MTSRERVLAALNHVEPDRVPIDLSGHRSSGISAIAYPKLRAQLGLEPRPTRVYDPIQQLAIMDEDVLERFGVDTIELGRAFAVEDEHWADWTLPDGTLCQMPVWALPERDGDRWVIRSDSGRVLAAMPDGALYFEQTYWIFLEGDDDPARIPEAMGESMWTAVASPPGPLVAGPDGAETLREGARRLRERTERAIIGLFGGNLLETGQFFYRNDQFLMLLAADPPRVHRFLDALVEFHLGNLERFLGAVGEHIDVILFGDDLGMQHGPQISPEMYREYFKPRHRAMWKRAKELADVKVMLHCCGGVRELLPDLIEAGLDAINPVQVSCRGMDAAGLKRDFGRDICFWGGGCDTQSVLPNGTPDEVADHVRGQVAALRLDGGFVFQQVHNIMANVPPANIVAMFDAVG